jgi:hypothetical protein
MLHFMMQARIQQPQAFFVPNINPGIIHRRAANVLYPPHQIFTRDLFHSMFDVGRSMFDVHPSTFSAFAPLREIMPSIPSKFVSMNA